MEKIKVIAIMGKSGSGKDTILNFVHEVTDTNKLISYTTRPPRDNEEEGINYFFITEEEFFHKDMIEHTKFNGWYYGTGIDKLSTEKINIGVFNPTGVRSLLALNDKLDVKVFYVKATDKQRLSRQLNREEDPNVKEIIRRFSADEENFKDIEDIPRIVLNNNDVSELNNNLNLLREFIGQF